MRSQVSKEELENEKLFLEIEKLKLEIARLKFQIHEYKSEIMETFNGTRGGISEGEQLIEEILSRDI